MNFYVGLLSLVVRSIVYVILKLGYSVCSQRPCWSKAPAVPNTVSVSASKYVIIIYAFGSAHEKFDV